MLKKFSAGAFFNGAAVLNEVYAIDSLCFLGNYNMENFIKIILNTEKIYCFFI